MIGASRTASLHVEIDSDTKGVSSGVDSASGKFAKLGSAAKLGGLAIAGGLVIAGKAAVDMIGKASDLNETISKSAQIFGEHQREMVAWSKTADTALGLSQNAALGAAASFGDMFQQIGFTEEQSAGFSKQVVRMAADLGSFNNLDTSDVLDRISGAFRGEYDSLQAVLPNISAARVQQEALNETHKQSVDALTAAEKATATFTLIQQDGARASGDFARTSGGLANQQKILHAQIENVQASIGTKLLPVAVALAKFTNEHLIPAAQEASVWIGKHLGPAFQDVGEFIQKHVIPAAREFEKWYVGKIVPGIEKTVTPIVEELRDGFQDLADKVHENGPELREVGEAFKKLAEFLYTKVFPALGFLESKYLHNVFKSIEFGIDLIADLVDAFEKLKAGIDNVKDAASSIHFPSPPSWLGKIPGLSAPSYDPGTPAAFGTAAWDGTSLADIFGGGGVALALQPVNVDNSINLEVNVDGSGIVDERAVANSVAEVLQRHATRLGRDIQFLGNPA